MSPMSPRTRRRASVKVVAGAAIAAAFVTGIAAAAAAAPQGAKLAPPTSTSTSTPTATPTATPTPTPAPEPGSGIFADITVELHAPKWDNAKVLHVSHVEIGPGAELTPSDVQSNRDEFGGGVYVDVSLNPDQIVVTGDGSGSYFDDITVTVVIDGFTFSSATTLSDNLLWEPEIGPELEPDSALGLRSSGTFRLSRSVITALSSPFPVLGTVSATGSTFTAHWSGEVPGGLADASAVFTFVRAAKPATASAAQPVFTG